MGKVSVSVSFLRSFFSAARKRPGSIHSSRRSAQPAAGFSLFPAGLLAALLIGLVALASPAQAAIMIQDALFTSAITNTQGANDAVFSQTFTNFSVTAGADCLIVDVGAFVQTPSPDNAMTITWNGTPLVATTLQSVGSTNVNDQIFYLFNPVVVTGGSLTITGDNRGASFGVYDLSGVDTTVLPTITGGTANPNGTGTTVSVTLPTTTAGQFAAISEACRGNGAPATAFTTTAASPTYTVNQQFSTSESGGQIYTGGADILSLSAGAGPTITAGNTGDNNGNSRRDISVAIFSPILGPAAINWTGATNGNWSLAGTDANWSSLSNSYTDGSNVLFSSSGSNTNITIVSPGVQPYGVTFANGATPYSFAGAAIAGTGSVTLSTSAGSVQFNSANTYTGNTTISGGTLQLGDPNAVQNSTVTLNVANGLAFAPSIVTFNLGGLSGGGNLLLSDTTGVAVTLSAGGNGAATAYSGNLSGNGSLTKVGSGSLSLSGSNVYSGGTLVSAGTLSLAGPASNLGTGAVTVNAGSMLSIPGGDLALGSTASAQTINLTNGGIFDQPAASSVTLSAVRTLNIGNGGGTIQVDNAAGTLVLGSAGQLAGTGALTIPEPGLVQINGANTLSGAINLNAGTLKGAAATASNVQATFGSGAINMNGGTLSVLNNGVLNNGTIFVGNTSALFAGGLGSNVSVSSTLSSALINVNQNTANTGNTFQFGTLSMAAGQALNVTGGNNYTALFTGGNFSGAGTLTFNPAAATSVAVLGGLNSVTPANIGSGTVLLGGNSTFTGGLNVTSTVVLWGAAPAANSSNQAFGTGAVTLNNGVTFPIVPALQGPSSFGTSSAPAGYVAGGLTASFYSFNAANQITQAAAAGAAPAAVESGVLLGDGYASNHPPLVTQVGLADGLAVYSGMLKINTAGAYSFQYANDDQLQVVIDGTPVVQVTGVTGLQTTLPTINLSAGYHSIVVKYDDEGAPGYYQLMYSGPDTATNAPGLTGGSAPNLEPIPANQLFYASNPNAAAANNYLAAAQVTNVFILSPSSTATLNGQGADLTTTLGSLNLYQNSQLNVVNQSLNSTVLGTGAIGVTGVTTIMGSGATLNPTTGVLNLLGGVNDEGYGVTKTGAGALILGSNGGNFTGNLNIAAGAVVVSASDALPQGTGSTVITATGSSYIDLNGTSNVSGSIVINGVPTTYSSSTPAALYNSSANAASTIGTLSIGYSGGASATAIGGFGDIAIDGTIQNGVAGTAWSKVGPDTLTLAGSNTFTGNVTVAAGILQLANSAALAGASGLVTVSNGATVDLDGQAVVSTKTLVLNTAGVTGLPMNNTLGSLINSSQSPAGYSGPINLTGNNAIGSNSYNPAAPGGTLTLSGTVGLNGTGAINKVGLDTLLITGPINYGATNTNVNLGTLDLTGPAGGFAAANTTITVTADAVLTLDNTNGNLNNRLGGRGLIINGGSFNVLGTSTSATTELINQGGNYLATFQSGGSVITLTPDTVKGNPLTVAVNSTATSMFNRSGGATALFRGTNLGVNPTGTVGSASITGSGTSVGSNQNNGQAVGQNGGYGSANVSIMPWALVDTSATGTGLGFAVFSAANGIQTLTSTSSNYVTALTGNDNVVATGALTATASAQTSINSLTVNSGASVAINAPSTLMLQSGGLLGLPGNSGITGNGWLTTNGDNREMIIQVPGGSTMTVNPTIYLTGGGLTVGGGGMAVLASPETYLGNTTVNAGLQLAGGVNTIFLPLQTAASAGNTGDGSQGQVLQVNAGGTLDLDGNNLWAAVVNSAGTLPNTGGTITNSSGTTATFRIGNNGNQTIAENISGNLNLIRDGNFTTTIESPNTYTGTTLIAGGVTNLVDLGSLQNSSSITISRSVLVWNDTGIQSVSNRLSATAPITFNGGAFVYDAREGAQGAQAAISLGPVTLNSGASLIQVNPSYGLAQATLASVTPNTADGASVTFSTLQNGNAGGSVGSNPRIYVTAAPTLTNGMIGAWATVLSNDPNNGNQYNLSFATYDAGAGILPLSAFYTATFSGTSNYYMNASRTVPSGGATINSLTMNNGGSTLSFTNSGDVLTVQSGGILGGTDNNARVIGSAALPGQLTPGAGQQQLFIYNGANTLTVNAKITNNGAAVNLVLDSASQTGNNPTIVLANANSYSGTTFVNGINVNLNSTLSTAGSAAGPAIPGNVVLFGGNNNGTDTMAAGNATMTLLASNQIAATANVLLDGTCELNLNSFSNTIANLTFNNDSASNNSIANGSNSGVGAVVMTGTAALTVSGSINATNLTSSFGICTLNGILNLNGGTQAINVDPVTMQPNQIGLELNATAVNGALVKTGLGVLGIGGLSPYSGTTTINQGTLATAVAGANIDNSQVVIGPAGTLDTRGLSSLTIGSLTGSGTLTNSGILNAGGTLVTGWDNTNSSFAGTLTNTSPSSLLNLTKIGTGNFNLSGNNLATNVNAPNLGTLTVSGGEVTLNSPSAVEGFTAYTVNTGGSLVVDDSVNAVNNRLGGSYQGATANVGNTTTDRTVNFQGGNLMILGNSAVPVTEDLGNVNLGNAANTAGGGVLTLSASNTGGVLVALINANFSNQNGYSTLLIRGDNLGQGTSAGTANTATVYLPNNPGYPGIVGQGGGNDGSTTMSIRPDILVDPSATGSGTSFAVRDTTTNLLRPLNASTELAASLASAGVTTNVGLGTSQALSLAASANSLTLSGAGAVNSAMGGAVDALSPGLPGLTINSGGILATSGTTSINVPVTTGGISTDIHVAGAGTVLDLNSPIYNTTNGIVKADAGALVINAPQYYTGASGTEINGGLLQLNGGNNTIMVQPTATVPNLLILGVNGGTLDLDGNSQAVSTLTSVNTLPGMGGTITNSSTAAVNFLTNSAGASTFAGPITNGAGALSFYKQGNNTLTLTGTSSYTGATYVEGGTLTLRDGGMLTGTPAVNVNYAILTLDNTGLLPIANGLGTAAINLNQGSLTLNARPGNDTFNLGASSLNAVQGAETITPTLYNGNQQTGSLVATFASLNQTTGATINFAPNSGALGGGLDNAYVYFNSAPALTNNIIAGWAVVNDSTGSNFATYTAAGVVALGGNGAAAYTGSILVSAGTDNVSSGASNSNIPGHTINSFAIRSPGGQVFENLNTATDMLTLGTGGLLINDAQNKGVFISGGQLSAGTSSAPAALYVYSNANTPSIYSQITNNSNGGPVSLVKSGAGNLTLIGQLTMAETSAWASGAGTINVQSSSGLFAGEVIAGGNGLAAGATVLSYTGNIVTMSANTTGAGAVGNWIEFDPAQVVTTTTQGSNQVTLTLASTQGWTTGMAVGGSGIPAGTTITGMSLISGSSYALTLSNSATVTSSSGTLSYGAQSNTYTGNTIVDQGQLNLNGFPGAVVIPGNLQISGFPVVMNTNPGQIAPTSNVSITGGGSLTLVGSNVLNSVSFTGIGGNNQTSLNIGGGLLTLSASNAITAQNDNTANTPQITGGSLAFANATPTITTSGMSPNSLIIAVPIVSSNGALAVSGTGAVVLSSTASTFSNGVNLNQGSIILGANSVPSTVGATVTSGPLGSGTLTTANGTTILSGAAAETIANAVVTNGNLNFGGALAANNVTLAGPVSLGGASPALTVVSPLVTATISGPLTTTNGLTMAGAGTLVLSNTANNFAGPAIVSGGILQLAVSGALGPAASVSVAANAALSLGAPQTFATLNNSGAAGGNVVLNGNALTVGSTNLSSTYSGAIVNGTTAGGGLTKSGNGMLELLGANSFSGSTTVSGGTLQIGDGIANNGLLTGPVVNNAALVFANPTATTYGGVISGGGGMTKTAAGTLTLGSNSSYAGPTVIAGGTLQLNVPAATGVALNVQGGENPGGTGSYSLTGNSLTISGAGNDFWGTTSEGEFVYTPVASNQNFDVAVHLASETNPGNQAWARAGIMVRQNASQTSVPGLIGDMTNNNSGPAIEYYSNQQNNNPNSGLPNISNMTNGMWERLVYTASTSTFTYYASDATGASTVPGSSQWVTIGSYAVTMTGSFDLGIGESSHITPAQATAVYDNLNGLFPPGANVLPVTTVLSIAATGTLDLDGSPQQLAALADYAPGLGGSIINSNTVTAAVLTLSPTGGSSTFSGTIQGGGALGALSLVMSGAGTQVLAGSNSYAGGTTIYSGILNITADAALGAPTGLLSFAGNGTLQAGTEGITLNPARNVTINNGVTATIDTATFNNMTIAGQIGGSGGLTKIGAGTLALTGSNSFSGGTTISFGTLQIGNGGASGTLGAAAGAVTNNATLAFSRSDSGLVVGNAISGGGAVVQLGPGTTTLTGTSSYNGSTTVQAGTLLVNGALLNSPVTVSAGGLFGGNGSAGNVTVLNGGGIDVSRNNGSTLSLATLTFGQNPTDITTLTVNAATSPANQSVPQLAITNPGGLDPVGSVAIDVGGSVALSGTYTLATYSGVIGGAGSNAFSLGSGLNSHQQGTLIITSNAIDLAVVATPLIWTGANSGQWAGGSNWKLSSNNATTDFLTGDPVVFDDSVGTAGAFGAPGATAVTINGGDVSPASVTFSNSAYNYSVSGTSGIAGPGSLSLTGTGTVTISTSNSYSGGTNINAGSTLQIGNGGGTGTLGSGPVVNNGVLAFGRSDNGLVVANSISGNGSVVQLGPGLTTLAASNSYGGGTIVSGGTLSVSQDANLGAVPTAAATNLSLNGGALLFTAPTTLSANRTISLGASGGTINIPFTATGAIDGATETGMVLFAGQITGSGGLTVNGGSGSNLGSGYNATAPYLLVLNSSNLNNYTGNTTINNATVTNDSNIPLGVNLLPATTVLTLTNSAVFALWQGNAAQTLAGLAGDGTTAIGTENNTSPSSLTINPAAGMTYTYAGMIGDVEVLGRGRNPGTALTLTIGGQGTQVLTGSDLFTGNASNLVISSGTLQIGNGGATGWLSPAAPIADNATLVFDRSNTVTQGTDFSTAGITGNGSLVQAGSGLLVLTAANAYGATTISSGTLQVDNGGATGTLGGGAVTDNATLAFARSDSAYAVPNSIGGTGVVVQLGPGMITLQGGNSYSGGTTVSGGTLQLGNMSALGTGGLTANAGVVDLAGNSPTIAGLSGVAGTITNSATNAQLLTIAQSGSSTFSGAIQNGVGGVNLTVSGGTQVLAGVNSSYTGPTTVSGGVLAVTSLAIGGSPSSIGASPNAYQFLVIDNGTLQYLGSSSTTDRSFQIGPSGMATIDASGSGPVSFNNTAGSAGVNTSSLIPGNATLTLTGSNTGNNTLSLTISDPHNGSTSLVKNGPGTWVLNGQSGYSGTTTVQQGTLVLANNPGGPVLDETAISVAGGATLAIQPAGTTMITGTSSGTGIGATLTLQPGSTFDMTPDGTIGSFTLQNEVSSGVGLTLYGATLKFNLGAAGADELIANGYSASCPSGTNTISVSGVGNSLLPTGTTYYPLIVATGGTLTGDFALSSSTVSVDGSTYNLALQNSGGTESISATLANAATFSGSGVWNGQGGTASWSPNTNWFDNSGNGVQAAPGVPSRAGAPDTAIFNGSDTAPAVTLDVPGISLAAVSFSNKNYTLTGSTLTMNGSSSGTATMTVSSGTQEIDSAVEIAGGNLAISLTNTGQLTLTNNISDDVAATGIPRSLTLTSADGTGTLILSGSNTYSGGTDVASGTLIAMNSASIPSGTSLIVGSGGAFTFAPATTLAPAASNVASASLTVSPVPEPGTIALLLAAVGVWCGRRIVRRRGRQS